MVKPLFDHSKERSWLLAFPSPTAMCVEAGPVERLLS
jgi:hypothetical protein